MDSAGERRRDGVDVGVVGRYDNAEMNVSRRSAAWVPPLTNYETVPLHVAMY